MSLCIVVVGQPRSGTSVTAGILHALGVPMGEVFLEAPAIIRGINPRGFFVDAEFERAIGGEWPHDFSEKRRAKCRELIAQRAHQHELWGLKQSWSTKLIPLAQQLCDVKVIRTQRDPAICKRSLLAWTGHSPSTADEIVEHFRLLADAIGGVPILDVAFDALIDDTRATVEAMAAFAGVPANEAAVELVDPSLRRVL